MAEDKTNHEYLPYAATYNIIMSYISIRSLCKGYTERRRRRRDGIGPEPNTGEDILVLDNINLDIEEGEIVCILGPSGCGKSTLLHIVAGFDHSYTGSVLIDNSQVTEPSPHHIFVFQLGGLLPWMTVLQNVGLGLRRMEDKTSMEEKVRDHIDLVDLAGFEHHYPYQLSGGMLRRVELARAMAVNPQVLFMDEPFTGLDFLTHMKMREEVLNLHEYMRKTIILVTHDIEDALIMGDRIVIFSERPAKVKLEHKLDFARPRDPVKDPALNALRDEVYLMLGVHHAL